MALEVYQPTLMVLKFQHIRITWRLCEARLGFKPRLSDFASLEWDSRFTFLMNSLMMLRPLV